MRNYCCLLLRLSSPCICCLQVILSVRDPGTWYNSTKETIWQARQVCYAAGRSSLLECTLCVT
jgi:hypothetical protein